MLRFWSRTLLVLASLFAASSVRAAPGDFTIVKSFAAPTTSPDGLAVDGDYLWNSDCGIPKLFKIEKATGKVVETIDISMVEDPTGAMIMIMPDHVEVAPGGKTLFVNDHDNKSVVYEFDPVAKKILKVNTRAYDNNMGVAWDGTLLWNIDPLGEKKIWAIDWAKGTNVRSIPAPDSNNCGIGWDGKCLWVSDLTTKKLYQVDPANGNIALSFITPGPSTRLPTGVDFDPATGHIWYADEDPKRATIFELAVEFGTTGACGQAPVTAPDAGMGVEDCDGGHEHMDATTHVMDAAEECDGGHDHDAGVMAHDGGHDHSAMDASEECDGSHDHVPAVDAGVDHGGHTSNGGGCGTTGPQLALFGAAITLALLFPRIRRRSSNR